MTKHTYEAMVSFVAEVLGIRDPIGTGGVSTDKQTRDEETALPVFSMQQVAFHDSYSDCWIILYDKVFDISRFLQEHPGGEDVMLEYAGRDATIAFRGVGHSVPALQSLDNYLVGILPKEERIFTSEGQCQWTTL